MDLLYGSSNDDDEEEEHNDVETLHDSAQKTNAFIKRPSPRIVETSAPTPGKRILSLASVLPAHILEALTKHPGNDDNSDMSDNDEDTLPIQHTATNPLKSANSSSSAFSSFLQDLHKVGLSSNTKHSQKNGGTHENAPTTQFLVDSEKTNVQLPSTRLGSDFVNTVTTTITKTSKETHLHSVRDIHNEDSLRHESQEQETKKFPAVAPPLATYIPPRRVRTIHSQAAPPVFDLHPEANKTNLTESSNNPCVSASSQVPVDATELQPFLDTSRALSRKEIERTLRRNTNGTLNIESLWNETGLTQTQQGVDPNLYAPNALPQKPAAPPWGLRNVATHLYDPSAGTTVAQDPSSGEPRSRKGRGKNQINHLLAQAVRLERVRSEQDQYHVASTGVKMHRANAKRKYGW